MKLPIALTLGLLLARETNAHAVKRALTVTSTVDLTTTVPCTTAPDSHPTAVPVSEYTDGQPQAPRVTTAAAVSEYTDGQPQAPTGTSQGTPEGSTPPGTTAAPTLTSTCSTPAFSYIPFSYTQQTSNRYPVPLSSPAPSKTYAQPFAVVSTLLPTGLTYTTYSLNPSAIEGGRYGESAYAALWNTISYSNTVLPFSATVSPTPVPTIGDVGSPINQLGLDHYENLINTCLEYGVTPVITLAHGDQSLHLQFNETAFPEAFLYYAKQVMTRYADRIPIWVTLNEPNINFGNHADNHNILMGHAMVYKWYKESLKDFIVGIEGNPLFLGADYPASVLSTTGINLTSLSTEDRAYFNGTVDFHSVDPYTAQFAYPPPNGIAACAANTSDPHYPTCVITTNVQANGWLNGD
ncbi:hypothetical protein MMC30_003045 [Trapelia coarctata]|nr:hypothetical protein [Trapelia coarctata]